MSNLIITPHCSRQLDGIYFHGFPPLIPSILPADSHRKKPNNRLSILSHPLPGGVGNIQQNNMHQIRYKTSTLQRPSGGATDLLNILHKPPSLLARFLIPIHLLINLPHHSPFSTLLYISKALTFHWMIIDLYIPFFTARTEGHIIIHCHQRHFSSSNINLVSRGYFKSSKVSQSSSNLMACLSNPAYLKIFTHPLLNTISQILYLLTVVLHTAKSKLLFCFIHSILSTCFLLVCSTRSRSTPHILHCRGLF